MTRGEQVGVALFVLGQAIGIGGSAYLAIDSGIPLMQDEALKAKMDNGSELTYDGQIAPPTGELATLNESIEQRYADLYKGLIYTSLAAGIPALVGVRLMLREGETDMQNVELTIA